MLWARHESKHFPVVTHLTLLINLISGGSVIPVVQTRPRLREVNHVPMIKRCSQLGIERSCTQQPVFLTLCHLLTHLLKQHILCMSWMPHIIHTVSVCLLNFSFLRCLSQGQTSPFKPSALTPTLGILPILSGNAWPGEILSHLVLRWCGVMSYSYIKKSTIFSQMYKSVLPTRQHALGFLLCEADALFPTFQPFSFIFSSSWCYLIFTVFW